MANDITPVQPSQGGRPSKLTPERAEKLLMAIRNGAPYTTACAYAGIDYSTLRRWVRKAQTPEASDDLVEFVRSLDKANAEAELAALARIKKAATDGSWQADAWWLERRFPAKWSLRDATNLPRVEINIDTGDQTTVAGIEISGDSMGDMHARLAARAREVKEKRNGMEVLDAEVVEDDADGFE